MDDYVDYFALNVMRYNRYARSKRAVEKTMQRYGITRPLTVECRKLSNDLPNEPNKRKDEVLRRFKCLRFPKAEHEVAQKLNELYVYSDIGNLLGSDAITHAVLKSLKIIENEIPPPEKNKVASRKSTSWSITNISKNKPKNETVCHLDGRLREDIDKYSRVGEIKRRLYSMPEYVRNRDRKGIKLPEAKLKSPSQQMNLNISKIRGLNTKMGHVIVKQVMKRKKMEDLKHQLNPYGKNAL